MMFVLSGEKKIEARKREKQRDKQTKIKTDRQTYNVNTENEKEFERETMKKEFVYLCTERITITFKVIVCVLAFEYKGNYVSAKAKTQQTNAKYK